MSTHNRRRIVVVTIIVFFAAAVLAALLHRGVAPEAARLLPDADGFVYVNLKSIRLLTSFSSQPSLTKDPEYQKFVDATGFEFERDLDHAAFAIHANGNGSDKRYSEVFVGRYDSTRMAEYLKKISRKTELYRDLTIYSIPIENRTVRVVFLGIDSVAISNLDDPSVIRGIVDRHKKLALPFGGPALVSKYYAHVPIGSQVWALMEIPPAPKDPRAARSLTLPGGFDIFVPSSSTMVASVRALTSIQARAVFYTQSEDDARHFADQATTFLGVLKTLQPNSSASDKDQDMRKVLDDIHVEQKEERAILTVELPISVLKKVFSQTPEDLKK